ncbi:hypothetical protein [Peribacillus kribbensis]|uniref:hypothetical protein n=1 Tax=Peribacillus kribbensis TaxID=356658 RepID=UPI000413623E|nr:hypothetical protein [Peribacillus kribbensis]
MPRKPAQTNEENTDKVVPLTANSTQEDVNSKLTRMLASVLEYLSDDEVEEIDIEYILDKTEGMREWWKNYQENNRQKIEEEIRNRLGELSLEDLHKIREQIKD